MLKNEIPMQACQSSRIKEHGYDAATQTLALRFKSGKGGIYTYANVPPELYEKFSQAPSIGQFFHQHIQGQPDAHPWTRHDDEEEES